MAHQYGDSKFIPPPPKRPMLDPGPSTSSQEFNLAKPAEDEEFEGLIVEGENGQLYAAFEDDPKHDGIDMEDVNTIEITEADGKHTMTIMALKGAHAALVEEGVDDEDVMRPQGLKGKTSQVLRRQGQCRCPECGDVFLNAARLERHLAVHQVYGSYLCPLCGKTYKYEYNLFHHWRRTCRDLNDLLGADENRKHMDVNSLRALVDDVASKKAEIGPIDIGISRSLLFQNGPLTKLEMPHNPLGRRGMTCAACGVMVLASHMARHLKIHRGLINPDERSACGGYFCDLCGLMFRQHFNLIKHWRTACPEIQANLPENVELTLDDRQLQIMVKDLIQKAATTEIEDSDIRNAGKKLTKDEFLRDEMLEPGASGEEPVVDARFIDEQGLVFADDFVDEEQTLVRRVEDKAKWSMDTLPVQCSLCYRTFANNGRLERHLAGFHASYGAHHCILCGNRFKYDYNLLYHYRKSCPYTRTFIDQDLRERMDAPGLRKIVRGLSQRQVKLTPTLGVARLSCTTAKPPSISNDELVRRQMFRTVGGSGSQPPPMMTVQKAGTKEPGQACPICGIIFYSEAGIDMHMRRAHAITLKEALAAREASEFRQLNEELEDEEDDEEAPPTLEPEVTPEEVASIEKSKAQASGSPEPVDHEDVAATTILHIKKADGTILEVRIEGAFHESDLQRLAATGELDIQDGDQIMIVGEAETVDVSGEYIEVHDEY